MASEKVPRVKKQAIYEVNVVKACRDEYIEKLDELQRKIDEEKAKETVLLERGKLSLDKGEQERIAREIKAIRDTLQIMKEDYDCFQDNVDMFKELLTLLDSFFMHGRFKYIVKKIPEKKLPEMVKDPDKREEVGDLLLSLFEDFNTAWQKYLLSMRKRKEKRAHIQKTKENFRERNETPDKEINSIMAEFGANNAEESIVAEKPKLNRK